MRYSKDFLDQVKARIRLSDLVSPYVRLQRAGKYLRGLSPFTQEKTPSFFVDDPAGRYTCYSSGQGGDHFSFLMAVKGLTFPEAVKSLAEEAGLALPDYSPAQAAKDRRRASLYDVVEAAAQFFELSLNGRAGQQARQYLSARGISEETACRFRLGFAPDSFSALTPALERQGITGDQLVAAGLSKRREDGSLYDLFRNRLIFPITDWRGKVIAFGGRALAQGEPAKYLNSPATDLFDKSQVLYNYKAAREARHDHKTGDGGTPPLVVAEGYMDVIALSDAGFLCAVAPLGTALTVPHLERLWQVSDRPVLCFDGDRAGRAAAHKAARLALPLLKPGRSLQFALLPSGQDPDDIVRQDGPQAMARLLASPLGLADMLWDMSFQADKMNSPDGQALFRKDLNDLIRSIQDPTMREYYGRELTQRRQAAERQAAQARFGRPDRAGARQSAEFRGGFPTRTRRAGAGESSPSRALRQSRLVRKAASGSERERLLLVAALNHPALLEHDLETFASLPLLNPQLDKLRNQILSKVGCDARLDRSSLLNHLNMAGFASIVEDLMVCSTLDTHAFARPDSPFDEAMKGWKHLLRLASAEQLDADIRAVQQDYEDSVKAENEILMAECWSRLVALKAQKHGLEPDKDI